MHLLSDDTNSLSSSSPSFTSLVLLNRCTGGLDRLSFTATAAALSRSSLLRPFLASSIGTPLTSRPTQPAPANTALTVRRRRRSQKGTVACPRRLHDSQERRQEGRGRMWGC